MELNDRIKGALVGFAYGDALGLGTEFMTHEEAAHYYPDGLRRFSDIIRDPHRVQWRQGEWTNDATILYILLESILEEGSLQVHRFAHKFKEWRDNETRDEIACIRACLKDPEWAEHPMATAHRVWQTSGLYEASNEALARSIAIGLTSPAETLDKDACIIVLITHDDSRCSASSVVMARMIRALLLTGEPAPLETLREGCNIYNARVRPFVDMAYNGDIKGLAIDDEETMTWTRKSMGCALWSLWHHDNAADTIHSVIDLGGDSNTNAALAGALAGMRYGYDSLPEEINNMKGLEYLLELSDRLTEYIDRKFFR